MDVQVNHPTLSVDFKTERVYPELEDLEVNPTMKEQTFKSNKYGFNEVKVNGFEGPVLDTENPIEITNIDNVIKISIEGDAVIKLIDDKTAIITSVETDLIKIEEIENYVDPQKVLYAESVDNILTNKEKYSIPPWAVVEFADGDIYLLTTRGNQNCYMLFNSNVIYVSSNYTTSNCVNINFFKWNGTSFVYENYDKKTTGLGNVKTIIGCGNNIYNIGGTIYKDLTKLVEYGDY